MMSRLRMQNFTTIGQGVSALRMVTDTRTNYFSNIDSSFFTFRNEKWLLQQCERVLGNSKKCASKSNCQVQHKIVLMRRNALLHIEIIVSELQFHFTQFGIRISN